MELKLSMRVVVIIIMNESNSKLSMITTYKNKIDDASITSCSVVGPSTGMVESKSIVENSRF